MKELIRKVSLLICTIFAPAIFLAISSIFTPAANGITKEQMLDFSRNNILYYDPSACQDTKDSIYATGDFAKIMSAKNADKSVFNGAGDIAAARWSDNDTGSMRRLLENYGDLAYQLGDVVGAPWIAILVQMRYEDPNSVCGANNFWGNGCPPSRAYAGGATIQGRNLGEGFVQYGKTLLNGFHNQAIGVADPKQYLEAIGPTWVQGDVNGAGYGSIEGMKVSVDALQAYVQSPEGQEIVKNFGNYHGNTNNLCNCGSGDESGAEWEDGWLVEGTFEGLKREDVAGKTELVGEIDAVGGFSTEDGRPNKILLHVTEGVTNGYAAYASGRSPAHFTIDLKKKEGYQHFTIEKPSMGLKNYDQAGAIQIAIVGFSDKKAEGYDAAYDVERFTNEDWDYLVKVLRAISEQTSIPLTSSLNWGYAAKMTPEDFVKYEGILGRMHVPDNERSDPGNIWNYIESAIDRSGGYNGACFTGGNGDINATAIKLAWPVNQHGVHNWNEPNPEYAKALIDVGMNTYGDTCAAAGGSCDAFVATVMRYSGVDPDFYCCGVSVGYMLDYLLTSGKYTEVQNGLGNLQPGDIRIGPHHIELYVEIDDTPYIASASYCERSGDIGVYYDNSFRVFRFKK